MSTVRLAVACDLSPGSLNNALALAAAAIGAELHIHEDDLEIAQKVFKDLGPIVVDVPTWGNWFLRFQTVDVWGSWPQ